MPRADLLIDLVRAGSRGDQTHFKRTVEAMVAEERAKQHNVLADRLAGSLQANGHPVQNISARSASGPEAFFHEVSPQRTLGSLVLSEAVTTACRELIEEQHRADLLRSYGLEPRHRVLLVGPPGNGKTSLAEAIAGDLAVPLFAVRYEAVITSFLGETGVRLARLFDYVRSRRCVLFFDEFDVVGKERGDVHETGEIKRLVSSLLLHIDALPSYVVAITATNHAELLDRAVWRRFQLRLTLPAPTTAQIGDWLRATELTLGGSGLGMPVQKVASQLAGASFAELEQFALEIRRRQVLDGPEADLRRIVTTRLAAWKTRQAVKEKGRTSSAKRRNA